MNAISVLVTGSAGFLGRHMMEALRRTPGVRALGFDLGNTAEEFDDGLRLSEVIFHLAGINRPQKVDEYESGNAGFTAEICARLEELGRRPVIVFASSIQAALGNPYGLSKKHAEDILREFSARTMTPVFLYRLNNLFGKWCRPNYNSVVATFCHNIAHDSPISISDPDCELELTYVDDVVAAFIKHLEHLPGNGQTCEYRMVERSFRIKLGALADLIRSFRQSRQTLKLPSLVDYFTRCLYATYLSYLEGADFAYDLEAKLDNRGSLAEFMKSEHFGQIFVSRTKPGITRGNHYHDTKVEKFLVLEGQGVVRFRRIDSNKVIEYRVDGREFKVLDIPPGYTHSIENVGCTDMVVLFWASEVFDPSNPDAFPQPVVAEPRPACVAGGKSSVGQ